MKKCICLYKSGKFYNAYNDDGLILHYLLGYKYTEYKKSVGFPEAAYSKVINELEKNKIGYQVYLKNDIIEEHEGIDKNYNKVLGDALKEYELESRLDRLKSKLDNFGIDELEKVIEAIERGTT